MVYLVNLVWGAEMITLSKKLRRDTGGVVTIEYGIFVAMVSIAAIVAMEALGASLKFILQMFFG